MKRILSTVIAITITLMLSAVDSRAWLRAVAFKELTHDAEIIALGRVTEVIVVRGIRVARFQVDRTLKGDAPLNIYFLAQGTWSCDISDAHEGESGLFFFSTYTFSERPMPPLESTPEEEHEYFGFVEFVGFRDEITTMTGGAPLFQLTDSGCGRLLTRTIDGVEHLTYSHVMMPQQVREIELSDKKNSSDRAAPTIDVILAASQLVAAETKTTSPVSRTTPN